MKAKEKIRKKQKIHSKITLKNIIIFLASMISLFYLVIFYNFYFVRNQAYAKETVANPIEPIKISQAEKVDIESKIRENANPGQKEEYRMKEVELEYLTQYKNNSNLPKGTIQVLQEGREGKQEVITKSIYQDGIFISEEQVSCKITKASVNKIVEIGTSNYKTSHEVKVGDILYVTSDRLSVRSEPKEDSLKVATLAKQDALKVLEIQKDWYKISCKSTIGYVKAESTTYLDSKETQKSTTPNKSKSQLISNLSFAMDLNKPSGLTLEQFQKVLTDNKDQNKIFEKNAEYFYYIEQQYNINGIFIAAVGIHESAWGTSKIARNKNNLFGYGAYDSNPYNGAYSFSSYAESIDLMARVFVKYYLNPKGTNIYGGEKASGSYYYGPTLAGVNTKYASDKNWANGVYQYMKYLYNKL